ncbi:hypothetical protein I5Q34_27660 [Streptomyces sp. AV19]|uniref:hypothetical protein n=1 Tax=Streptomyces sp. AV19 TaxID=2793068 RepID=UPI0018FED757|nr:hypothetical protein [Streptomyces sp. AV19]MBH1938003.1 hypothetical protein [Streptomyces sp. AV19]MDG4536618.1 hypothetical protein [Streptomyces sp. AV19]
MTEYNPLADEALAWALTQQAAPLADAARLGAQRARDAYEKREEYPGLAALLATCNQVQRQAKEREATPAKPARKTRDQRQAEAAMNQARHFTGGAQ